MSLLGRFFQWRTRRRHARHKLWLRQNKVVTSCDWRAFSSNYMRSLRK